METTKLYDIFRKFFPLFDVKEFAKIGEFSIMIKTSVPKLEFIFTFHSPLEWRLETCEMFGKELDKRAEIDLAIEGDNYNE